MITAAGNNLAVSTVIAGTLDTISVISVQNASGEFFRKIPTTIEIISVGKKRFTFWLDETEANDIIVGVSLYGNGATITPGTGTEISSQALALEKDDTQSLTIEWTLEVKNGLC